MIGSDRAVADRMRSAQSAAAGIGAACLVASFVGGFFDPAEFFPSYLFAYVFWIGLTLGSMAVLMVHYQVGGSWGFVTRRILEAGMLTLPLMVVLFIPLLFGLRVLFPWARPEVLAVDAVYREQRVYLNVGFFVARAGLYFLSWLLCAGFLARWSTALDRSPDPRLPVRLRRLSGGGLVLYSVTMFFASVDWVMSVEPHWSSSIYGMITLASQGLSGFALATGVLVLLSGSPTLGPLATRRLLNDLGNLLLTAVMLWAYVSFSQYLIIWAEDLPREIGWYLHRTSRGWKGMALSLVLFHFAVPFVLLLFRAVKRSAAWIAAVAWGLLALGLVDDFWRVLPAFRPTGLGIHWTDITAPAGIGGLWIAWFLARLRRRPLLPLHDPEFSPRAAEAEFRA